MTASTTPPLLSHLAHVGRAPVLVTGATGVLGRHVMEELGLADTPARALCHRQIVEDGVDAAPGDLRTGRGLRFALDGVKAVIHVAGSNAESFEKTALAHLLDAIDRYAPETHVVFVSQVGCWESSRAAARGKCDAENLLAEWQGRFSILRAAPGHQRVYTAVHGPGLYGGPTTMNVTPVDLDFVARICVDTALRHMPLATPTVIYGPETHTLHEFAQLCAHLEGYRGIPGVLKAPVTASVLRGDVWESVPPKTERRDASSELNPDAVVRGGADFAAWWALSHRQ